MTNRSNSKSRTHKAFFDRYGPWAVVTGASDGIGLAFAWELAARGLNLILVSRSGYILEDIGTALAQEHGVRFHVIAADLSRPEAVDTTLADCRDFEIGLMIASAGYGSAGPLIHSDQASELGMVDVNCRAVLAMTNHFARRFTDRKGGGLVLMSSLFAF